MYYNSSSRSYKPGTLVEVPVRSYKPVALVDAPAMYKSDSDLQPVAVSEVEIEKRRQQKSERVELSQPFNFVLPTDYVPLDEVLILPSKNQTRLPMAQRLKGWVREIRRRSSGRLDFFYYHKDSREKPYRSFRDVKRFIYLGFFPSTENGDKHLEQWVLDQPNPLEEGAATPLASAAPNTNVQMPKEKRPRGPKLRTEIVELSEPFNFVLPPDYVPLEDDDDEEIQKLSNGEVMWLPLAQRLKGWIRETRCRASGRLDSFYYHEGSGEKQYRSFRDVKRYIYLGFFPYAEDGDKHLDQWVWDQPDPREEGTPSASAASNSITTTQIQGELCLSSCSNTNQLIVKPERQEHEYLSLQY